jgi:glycosyltransferase involved in cell wall biosynthesis
LWEGFNLPVVEAAASGTVGVAFDIGAHPETTPFLVRDPIDLRELLQAWANDRALLSKASHDAYLFARKKFNWEESSQLLSEHLSEVLGLYKRRRRYLDFFLLRVLRALAREGIRGFTRLAITKVRQNLRR